MGASAPSPSSLLAAKYPPIDFRSVSESSQAKTRRSRKVSTSWKILGNQEPSRLLGDQLVRGISVHLAVLLGLQRASIQLLASSSSLCTMPSCKGTTVQCLLMDRQAVARRIP